MRKRWWRVEGWGGRGSREGVKEWRKAAGGRRERGKQGMGEGVGKGVKEWRKEGERQTRDGRGRREGA